MENSKQSSKRNHKVLAVFILLTIINFTLSHGSYNLVEKVTVAGAVSSTSFLASLSKLIISSGSKLRIYQASASAATFQASEYNTASITLVTLPTI